MNIDHSKLYSSAADFFNLQGSVVMRMTPECAIDVCQQAAERGFIVVRVEGGIWHSPGIEARLDCIWDGGDPPITKEAAHENNELAAAFIKEEMDVHAVFILTTPPITGYLHLARPE